MTDQNATAWEAAYSRFETPAEERAKFIRRLRSLGLDKLDHSSRVLELFCGRGNGLHAWRSLGFSRVEGLDLSEALLDQFEGDAPVRVGDARSLPFDSDTFDVVCVQGGLHHLETLTDLEACLDEAVRVLPKAGRFVAVEPWDTPFLRLVHAATRVSLLRAAWTKLDALATMIEHERDTYEAWLRSADRVREVLEQRFEPEVFRIGRGKLMMVARPRDGSSLSVTPRHHQDASR